MSYGELAERLRSARLSAIRFDPRAAWTAARESMRRLSKTAKAWSVYNELKSIFASYPEIYFLQSGWAGLIFFAVTLVNPAMGICGILAVLSAYAFARFIKMDREFLRSGFYTYNPLLVGLQIGSMFQLTLLSCLLTVIVGMLAFVLTVAMAHWFSTYLVLPILSLPFVLVGWSVHLAARHYSNLMVNFEAAPPLFADPDWPVWLNGFFRSFGAILFCPNVAAGLAIAAIVLCHSRILFALAIFGYAIGATLRTHMFGAFDPSFGDFSNFNFILIAMAVGGVYLVPSLGSYAMAALAVALSTVVLDSIQSVCAIHHVPAFTLPFNVVSLSFIYMLGVIRNTRVAQLIGRTPEETLEIHTARRMRYTGQLRTLFMPFSGQWTVWQAFDGPWTHRGSWRYAYDFVITDDDDKTHTGDGGKLEDYLCYRKPVLSPVRGRVIQIVDDLPDNPPGGGDKCNNWGNLVVIQDPRGYFVEISHFSEKSLRVKVGDSVERGTVLGLCGNSGYSPQPHIHVQVQATEHVGGATLPFSFVSYVDGGAFNSNDCPAVGARVEPLYTDKSIDARTEFILDDVHEYDLFRDGVKKGRLALTVKMALDGTFYFDSERGKLYFGKHEGTFYAHRAEGTDPWLRMLVLAMPRMPLGHRTKLAWNDVVPIGSAATGAKKLLAQFLSSFYPPLSAVPVSQSKPERNVIAGTVRGSFFNPEIKTEVRLDERSGFSLFKIGAYELRRIEHENK